MYQGLSAGLTFSGCFTLFLASKYDCPCSLIVFATPSETRLASSAHAANGDTCDAIASAAAPSQLDLDFASAFSTIVLTAS
nr:hypothetical protein [Streptoalloteichus hindustanus]